MKQNSTKAAVLWRAGLAAGLLFLVPFMTANARTTYGLTTAACVGWAGPPFCGGGNAADRYAQSGNGAYTCTWTDATPPTIKGVTASFYWHNYRTTLLPTITLNGTSAVGLSIPPLNSSCVNGNGTTQTASFPVSAYNSGASNTISFSNPDGVNYIVLSTYTGTNLGTNIQVLITLNTGSAISTPTAGGFTNLTAPLISWVPFPSATNYQLQIDTVPFFNDVGGALITKTINGTTGYTLTGTAPELLTNAVTYYGRVQALNGPESGIWSYINDFTVDNTAPPAPTLNSPINGVATPTQTPTFNWNPVTSGTE